jgi:hypothetical protein
MLSFRSSSTMFFLYPSPPHFPSTPLSTFRLASTAFVLFALPPRSSRSCWLTAFMVFALAHLFRKGRLIKAVRIGVLEPRHGRSTPSTSFESIDWRPRVHPSVQVLFECPAGPGLTHPELHNIFLTATVIHQLMIH